MTQQRTLPAPARSDGAPQAGRKSTFRPEIQGLRSLAVLMVMSYHIWLGRVSGGVDVFLLISAFLMTLQFVGRYEQGRPMALLKHWLHLFRRLVPAAVTVIVAVIAASILFLPRTRWLEVISQGWASLSYVENWLLQSQATDYYASDHSQASPFQHFWSLSIQGQIFILWPLIFAGAALVAKRFRLRYRVLLCYIFALIFLGSLIYSVLFTKAEQTEAYFDTGARLWEFALGTLVALALPSLRLPRSWRLALGWLGIVAMLSCGLLLNVQASFPGFVALWPTLAAACVIVAGQTGSKLGVDRFLSSGPLVRLGDMSYALYLWHWPVLVISLTATDKDRAGPITGSIIVAVSMVLAYVTTRFIEKPWRGWKWPELKRRRALIAIAAAAAIAAVPLAAWQLQINYALAAASSQAWVNNPGARSLDPAYVGGADKSAPLLPTLATAADEWPRYAGGCTSDEKALTNICTNGKQNAAKTVVIIGNSHAHVWSTPILTLADKYGWKVEAITKGYCPVTVGPAPGLSDGCLDFNKDTLKKVLAMKPDLVVTTSTRTDPDPTSTEFMDPGWVPPIKAINDAGIPVVALRDTPRMHEAVPACLEKNPNNYSACGSTTAENYQPASPDASVAAQLPATKFLDFSQYFCQDDVCPAVIGNVMVYKDDNHVTRTYMESLTPYFETQFLAATGWNTQ
ncbi:Peptidoglycan/LPS O-acetylase OafA/YrhL, contains acyltransferase and SGNH-hydrolase domains [Arthrobacter sp. ok909]|uniref:acyltransferase family protein n=1 Tax=Arthrobacter sp. ok909 TaxID=1761746 RepID=UPI0008886B48|nr:acyltransferase family protein [Arthrobacter sp. ok909]SDP38349.1 Peptidoglycan/LPS O-acetylase OafA/YrhL, contains acyltransferase and SGNH-hydrolase domains [Arthrobacter sp. ok909]